MTTYNAQTVRTLSEITGQTQDEVIGMLDLLYGRDLTEAETAELIEGSRNAREIELAAKREG